MLLQLCGTANTLECCGLSSISASTVLWFPHGKTKQLNSLGLLVCVFTYCKPGDAHELLRGTVLLLHHHMERLNPEESGKMCYKVNTNLKLQSSIVYIG